MKSRALANIAIIVLLSITLVACDKGDNGSSSQANIPTDRTLEFSLFPATYFGGSYSAYYSLVGAMSNGDGVRATFSTQSGSTATFNTQSVTTIEELTAITNATTGAVTTSLREIYYSTDMNNLTILGEYRTIDGVTIIATSPSVLPVTAKIGDFGMVGTYTLSDGTSSSVTWSLEDGYNGKAKLIITTTVQNASNTLYSTTVNSWTISQDGTRGALRITVTYHQQNNLTLTMSGNKQ